MNTVRGTRDAVRRLLAPRPLPPAIRYLPSATCLLLLAAPAHAAPLPVTRGSLTVTVQDAADARHLPLVFRTWEKAVSDLRALGLTPPRAQLHAARNAADFARRSGEPASIAASTRGNVIYTQRLGALSGRGLLAGTIRHEAFHVAQPAHLPRWLAEGLARVFSGEAAREGAPHPDRPSGLEALSAAQLDARLLGRTPGEAGPAYAEATRRARTLVAKVGWKAALAGAER